MSSQEQKDEFLNTGLRFLGARQEQSAPSEEEKLMPRDENSEPAVGAFNSDLKSQDLGLEGEYPDSEEAIELRKREAWSGLSAALRYMNEDAKFGTNVHLNSTKLEKLSELSNEPQERIITAALNLYELALLAKKNGKKMAIIEPDQAAITEVVGM